MAKPAILIPLILAFLLVGCAPSGYSPPKAHHQSVSVDEDSSIDITLSASIWANDSVTWTIVNDPSHGSLTGTPPNNTYSPEPNYHGSDSFSFLVDDWYHESNMATVFITVNPVNDPPSDTSADIITSINMTSVGVTPTVIDIDNGESFTFSILTQPLSGVAFVLSDRLYYTPNPDISGSDSFSYRAFDSGYEQVDGIATVTILAPNNPPVANSQTILANEDVGEPIILTGSDPDGDLLSYAIVSHPSHGALSGTPPNLTYLSALDFYGTDGFTFLVHDGSNDSDVATVDITVSPVNDPPTETQALIVTDEDTSSAGVTPTVEDVDSGESFIFSILTSPSLGTAQVLSNQLYYQPNPNIFGSDSFTYRAFDSGDDYVDGTAAVTIVAFNDAPVANSQSVTADEDIFEPIILTGSDIDGDELSYVLVTEPSNGTLSGIPPNVTYISKPDFSGTDTFSFRVNDGSVDSISAIVRLTVTPQPDIWFVDLDATGIADGRSWSNAFSHPQTGIDLAVTGDEVWVAGGTYASMDTVGSMPVLAMKNGVDIYGGFEGSETGLSERDLSSHTTVLDGEYLVDNVVVGASSARLDGFVITGGYSETSNGAGMLNDGVSGLRVINSVFIGNETATDEGGGMYNNSAEIEIGNCVFTANSALRGGGINFRRSTAYIVNTTVVGNTASDEGGGIYNRDDIISLVNSIVYDNAPNQIFDKGKGGETVVSYSDIQQDGYAGADGNINADPVFSDDDYRLESTSPCIEAGDNTAVMSTSYFYDLDGNDRILDGDGDDTATVDMGAYEYIP